MSITRRAALVLALGALPALSVSPALAAETTVKVSLWDKGDGAMDALGKAPPMGFAMAGAADKAKMATMGVTVTPDAVPAGKVTFEVTNDSKSTIHEMIVSPIKDMSAPLPYLDDEMRVDEDAAGHLGEVSELDPGASGALTLNLKPGRYILFCNIPGHYVLGMWTPFTVK